MAKQKPFYARIDPTKQVGLALALLLASILLSRESSLAQWELRTFDAIYSLPSFLQPFFYIITQFGSIYVFGVLLVLYFTRKHYHVVIRLLMTGTLAYLLSGFAKSIWGRARPDQLIDNLVTFDYAQGPGFPSGHTALATALALTVGHYLKGNYHWIPVIWIVLVGISRMYLGVHLPLDIIGGFAIGWLCYALFRHVRIYDTTQRHFKK